MHQGHKKEGLRVFPFCEANQLKYFWTTAAESSVQPLPGLASCVSHISASDRVARSSGPLAVPRQNHTMAQSGGSQPFPWSSRDFIPSLGGECDQHTDCGLRAISGA